MADKYVDLTGEELFVRPPKPCESHKDSESSVIPVLLSLVAIGLGVFVIHHVCVNQRMYKLESGQKEIMEDIAEMKQRNITIEKKVMATNYKVDAMKSILDYTNNEYLNWYPIIAKRV